jgi:D-3-phosphoglycerate dehydrogenase
MSRPVVAVLGARWPDLSIEEEVLQPLGPTIRENDGIDADAIRKTISDADVVLVGPAPRLDGEALAVFSGRGVVRYGTGVDNVDLDAANRGGVWVVVVPDYGTEAVAIHTLSLVLACLRRLRLADHLVRDGRWDLDSLRPLHTPTSLSAGVVGFGSIGRRVTQLLLAVGFGRLLVTPGRAQAGEIEDVEVASLGELLGACDVVTLHASASVGGEPILDRAALQLMRDGSMLVNTARGSLVDTRSLVEGLIAGRPAIAALDVTDPEPPDLTVFGAVEDRIIFTPHMAWYTEESEIELRRSAASEAFRLLSGLEPLNPVVRPG